MITSNAQIISAVASGGGGGSTPTLDQVLNPVADKTFDLSGFNLTFEGTSGTSAIALIQAGSGGISLTDTGGGGIGIIVSSGVGGIVIDTPAASLEGITIRNQGTGAASGILITNIGGGDGGIAITDTSAGGIAITGAGGGIALISTGGIALLGDGSSNGNPIEIDATGTNAGVKVTLQLNPTGNPILLNSNGATTSAVAPATAGSTGIIGTILWAASGGLNYIYVCVAANTWQRVLLSTF